MRLMNPNELYARACARKRGHKYHAVRTPNADGTVSDSRHEARCDAVMMAYARNPEVASVTRKVKYPLEINAVRICTYISDWTVTYRDGRVEVFDAKGFKTPVYRLKRRLMLALYGIEIIEI